MAGHRHAPCFANGKWIKTEDEFWAAWPEGDGNEKAFEATGYKQWFQVGDPDALALPLTLTVYARAEGTPRYMVSLETHMDMDWVYAHELPDVMAVLGQWMPTIQAAAISEVVRQFNDPHGQNRDVVDLLTQLTGKS
ncbi:hypothetical protein ACWGSK_24020 [Nocardiopsis sp. NPDC055551]|uniref:hypothetical protein n=1 Tax=Nocardiopsis sp. NPDC006832 TaxID=3157188 RepID=UPI0033F9DD34